MLVEKVLDGSYMHSLITKPSGCGEQNLAAMTLPITALMYLDKTNQWDKVGTSERDIAVEHIQEGKDIYISSVVNHVLIECIF